MQRGAVRITVGGVATDVPLGTFAAADLAQYDAPTNTIKGASLTSLGLDAATLQAKMLKIASMRG